MKHQNFQAASLTFVLLLHANVRAFKFHCNVMVNWRRGGKKGITAKFFILAKLSMFKEYFSFPDLNGKLVLLSSEFFKEKG